MPKKAEVFSNWAGLDGHMGGHYLSALVIHYASTGDEECKRRMDYMLSELKRCQEKNGDGYIGGVPGGATLWSEIKKGNIEPSGNGGHPGITCTRCMRDCAMPGCMPIVKRRVRCSWIIVTGGIGVISPLSDEQMEQMLGNEFGGMDEIYADAYAMTGDKKYLDAPNASHISGYWTVWRQVWITLITNMPTRKYLKPSATDALAELDGDRTYENAATFFWSTVVGNRSLSFGGNSRREHFPSKEDCKSYAEEREGPESCNT